MESSDIRAEAVPREKRYFTLAEANRALPLVRRIVTDVTETHREARRLHLRVEAFRNEGRPTDADREQDALARRLDRLGQLVEELADVGALLKDLQVGLVDFRAVHEGREVLLCWRLGEERIEHWHEVSDGFAGRQPASLLDDRARGEE